MEEWNKDDVSESGSVAFCGKKDDGPSGSSDGGPAGSSGGDSTPLPPTQPAPSDGDSAPLPPTQPSPSGGTTDGDSSSGSPGNGGSSSGGSSGPGWKEVPIGDDSEPVGEGQTPQRNIRTDGRNSGEITEASEETIPATEIVEITIFDNFREPEYPVATEQPRSDIDSLGVLAMVFIALGLAGALILGLVAARGKKRKKR